MRSRAIAYAPLGLLALVSAISVACGASDFDPASQLNSVRILASAANTPYAKPGDMVHVDVLAVDDRADRTRPMNFYWVPFLCENPAGDAYYGCFAPSGGGDGGASREGGAGSGFGGQASVLLRAGVDLTPFLKTGTGYDFQMPEDAVTTHPPVQGLDAPYGLVILFNVACAGHVKTTGIDPAAGPQQVPIGCFDDNGAPLDSSQYVLGYTRVYAYDTRTNANPVIQSVMFQGNVVDITKPVTVDHCTTALRRDCPELLFDVSVPLSSWELNPSDTDPDGTERHEQIWADYFADVGQFEGGARLLFDPAQGQINGTAIKYQAPNEVGDGTVYLVVHDNRSGTSWVSFTIHVQ